MITDVKTARNASPDKQSFWKFNAKWVVLFVICVSISLQFVVFVTKRFTNPYRFPELTRPNTNGVNGRTRVKNVGTVVEKLVYRNASLRTAVTNINHGPGSKEDALGDNVIFSNKTDGFIISKPTFSELTSLKQAYTKPASSARSDFPLVLSQSFKVNSSKEKQYNILIFGFKGRLAQRLDFLIMQNGSWGRTISCGENVTINVHVGNASANFERQNAVVFNMDETAVAKESETLVSMQTSSKQAWIYYGREPAVRMRRLFRGCGNLPLHGIWSFQRHSEVRMAYGSFVQTTQMTSTNQPASFWSRGKNKLVAWMARNCLQTFWPRTKFVESLNVHIPVDIYGTCGNLPCPFVPIKECRNRLSRYKFYLALESAECEDYVTEKMWETALANGIVPVVYGASKSTYLRQAPPNSYIYVGDFNSTKALADYLKMLDKNPTLYAKYFEWRYMGHIEVPKRAGESLRPRLFCSLIPFITKVEKGGVKRKAFSEFPFYKSCRLLKGNDLSPNYLPPLKHRAKHWKLNW
ncbi:uncharacterized protein LOC117305256 [Asterias rubens]|uniref:uncharacterized protein LOC117305256 n=1 Tax=Asterias rubens TaxID=7604 RepID=UPI001454EE83|nr:uncharacterized protein LOC117305256 [Asterias rubens]